MADLSDVETALVNSVTDILYPQGLTGPCIVGSGARIYRGLPMTSALRVDLGRVVLNVSVSSLPDTSRNTTRWSGYGWVGATLPGVAVGVSGNVASFSGTPNAGDLAGFLIADTAYVYQARAGDSAGLVAAALCDLVRADRICWLQGNVVTVPGVTSMVGRTGSLQASTIEVGRQEQGFRVTVWSPTPAMRDAACTAIGAQLAQIAFLPLADGSGGRLQYHRTSSSDDGQDAGVYRRDLDYEVEYPTTVTQMLPAMLFGDLVCNGFATFA